MPNFIQIASFMHVLDIKAALAFFRDISGFKATWREGDGVYPERGRPGAELIVKRSCHVLEKSGSVC